jgi:hypothetical protein
MTNWGAVVLVAVCGCSTGITAPMDLSAGSGSDLSAAGASDMSSCTLTYSGDASATVACRVFLCQPTPGTMEWLDITGPIDNPTQSSSHFIVDGKLAVRSYTAAQLSSFDAAVLLGGKYYSLQPTTPGAAVALTVESVAEPTSDPCTGIAHGSLQTTLAEQVTDDAGGSANGPGRVTLNARF